MNKKNWRRAGLLLLSLALLSPLLAARPAATQGLFADGSFSKLWERTDRVVQVAPATRSWFWGPVAGAVKSERYEQSATGQRLVQYFDKARMEINNPNGDRNSEWFVTTGLLVVELVSGNMQVGDSQFVQRSPSVATVAGDPADPNAPTYASFAAVSSINSNNRAESRTGSPATATINRAGQVGDDPEKSGDPSAVLVAYSDIFGHNIPRAIWEFMNQGGPVLENGTLNQVRPIANWIFTMGYPISEPYWSRVQADGQTIDVLIQLFQRRALVYIPSYQAPWNVQMANVGAQYYQWLYEEPLPPAESTATPTNTPLPPTNTPIAPTNTPVPPTSTSVPATSTPVSASSTSVPATSTSAPTVAAGTPTVAATVPPGGIPANVDGEVTPSQGPAGTVFNFHIYNFQPVENVAAVFTEPSGNTFDSGLNRVTSQSGEISGLTIDSTGFTEGVWSITFVGSASRHQSIVYFRVGNPPTQPPSATPTLPPATPTRTTAPGQPTATTQPAPPTATRLPSGPTPTPLPGATLSVSPTEGQHTTLFSFTGSGFTPNEKVDYWFVDPANRYWYPSAGRQLTATAAGGIGFQMVPNDAFFDVPPGNWSFHVLARTSGRGAEVTFVVRQ